MKKYAFPLIMWLLFEAIAITLWLALDNLFYLFNFSYIGLCLAFGIGLLYQEGEICPPYGAVGRGVVYAGIPRHSLRENRQIEGFCIICFRGLLRLRLFTIALQKFLAPSCLAADGAGTPAGRRWFWICFPTRFRADPAKTSPLSAILCLPFLFYLSARSFFFMRRIWTGSCSGVLSSAMRCITP